MEGRGYPYKFPPTSFHQFLSRDLRLLGNLMRLFQFLHYWLPGKEVCTWQTLLTNHLKPLGAIILKRVFFQKWSCFGSGSCGWSFINLFFRKYDIIYALCLYLSLQKKSFQRGGFQWSFKYCPNIVSQHAYLLSNTLIILPPSSNTLLQL